MENQRVWRGICALLILLAGLAFPLNGYAVADIRQEVLNGAELAPQSPGSRALDEYLENLMADILTEDMDTYGKVQVCYDYITQNTAYGNHMAYLGVTVDNGVSCGDIYHSYGEIEGFGAVALTAHTGMCNAYASGFILMARKIGLDADLVTGSTKNSGGGYSYHQWAEITIDGTVYLFDPQLEQGLAAAGMQPYSVFCKTYEEVPGRFIKY